ncbi:MAG: hypothetical protein IJS63_00135 [Bacteroidaceae bacterium]|nr:hypothetical protein [Bacteroidaceae bacterium]
MKKIVFLAFASFLTMCDAFAQKEVSGVYVGGHIRRERPGTITTLRNSGFTYVILFNVHVDPDGTLKTDGETICKDGVYVFQQTQPYYQQDVKNLKTQPTSISRVEICIGGWGNNSYGNIKNLVNSQGTGSSSILYKNFKALIEAVPEIDAVNNDQEQDYDVASAAKFHVMMYNLGYKTTFAPYTNKSYWQQLNNEIRKTKPKAVDRVMVQCYDGGAGNVNNVGSWTFTGVTERHAGLLNYSNDWSVEKNMEQFQKWKDDGVATGGFVWVYNDESWDLNAWASGMNRVFGAVTVPEEQVVVRLYSERNYEGYCVSLPAGKFTQADLAVYGLKAKDLSSIEIVDDFYQVRCFKTTNCTGTARKITKTTKTLATYDNTICSVIVEPNPTAINEIKNEELRMKNDEGTIYNLAGQRLDKMQKGINIVGGKKVLY